MAPAVRLLAVASLMAVFGSAEPVSAQQRDTADLRRQAQQQLGRDISQQEILDRLRASGMTRAQVRARLQSMGYDPSLADAYFDALESGSDDAPGERPPSDLVRAMDRLGLSVVPDSLQRMYAHDFIADSIRRLVLDSLLADSARLDSLRREARLPIFGMELFRAGTTQFTPLTWGPVGPNYRLGPGDELVLILTGDVETAYELEVAREGFVVIPDVGRVHVSGLTLGELENRLYSQLGQVYSGVERGPGATTQFQLSLGELRTNEVYLVGEVQRPGAYQVSAVSTVLNALYQAQGPNRTGSFRNVQVRRGNELVTTVDLYEYLLTGASSTDIQLQHGDRVFVPIVERRVAIDGAVRRTARYEMKDGETLADLIAFAGGFRADAVVNRVQIDRVLSPEDRAPGVDRVLIDVSVADLAEVELRDGDQITVFGVSEERRNLVAAAGEVRRPGIYEWRPGMTLSQLVQRAGGLSERAYEPRVQIYRLNEATGTRRLVPASLRRDEAGRPTGVDVLLADRDSVVFLSAATLAVVDSVEIAGFVKAPGRYEYAEGMSVQDLILAAGGFVEGANVLDAELARLTDPRSRTDSAAVVYRVTLADSAALAEAMLAGADRMLPTWMERSREVPLEPSDRVLIGQAPGYEPPRTVTVSGEVLRPGPYALTTRDARLSDLIARAGGVTRDAYVRGAQLVRDSMLVATNLHEALEDPDDAEDIMLADGDSLHVPRLDPIVRVTGAVVFESRVAYRPGAGLDYYVEQAGGYTRNADRRRASVTYANGERETVDRFLWFSTKPEPGPGSMVFVPPIPAEERDSGVNWSQIVQSTTAVLGTVATLIFAYTQVNN